MKFEITVEAVLCRDDCTDEQVSNTLEALMKALVDLGATDPFVGGSVTKRTVEIALVVDAESEELAFAEGSRFIGEAFQGLGLDLTPGSEAADLSWSQTTVRPAAVA